MYISQVLKGGQHVTVGPEPTGTHVHTLQVQIPARHPESLVNKGRGRSKEQRLKQTAAKTNITSRTGQTLGLGDCRTPRNDRGVRLSQGTKSTPKHRARRR